MYCICSVYTLNVHVHTHMFAVDLYLVTLSVSIFVCLKERLNVVVVLIPDSLNSFPSKCQEVWRSKDQVNIDQTFKQYYILYYTLHVQSECLLLCIDV